MNVRPRHLQRGPTAPTSITHPGHRVSPTITAATINDCVFIPPPPPPPHSVIGGIPCVLPKCPVKGYFSRTKVRLVVHNSPFNTPDLGCVFIRREHAFEYPKKYRVGGGGGGGGGSRGVHFQNIHVQVE